MSRVLLVSNQKGKPILDADEDIRIKVLAADIKSGAAMSPTDCAIAKSCKRSVAGVVAATINKSVSYLEFEDKILRFITPQSAAREIVAFDRGAPFAAGDYYLKRPSATKMLGRAQIGKRKKGAGTTGPKRPTPHVTVMVRGA